MNESGLRPGRWLPRTGLAALGLLALGAAAYRFPVPPDLGWDAAVLPLAALGFGMFGVAAAMGTAWLPAALHGGLYLFAQACGLQLVNAERYANYAHFAPWTHLGVRVAWLAPVGVQWVLGLVALRSLRPPSIPGTGTRVRATAVFAVLAFSAAVPTVSLARYAGETALGLAVTLGAMLNLLSFARTLPAEELEAVRTWVAARVSLGSGTGQAGSWDGRLPWVAAGLATVVAAVFARFVLGGVPHIDDSISNLFQARTMALGTLSVAAPPDSAAFHVVEVLNTGGRWFGYGFPGWPAVLALGVTAGLPWLVNPLLAGIAILLTHRLLLRLHDRGTANATALLLAASPWLLFMSAEMMGHPLSLVLALTALIAVVHASGGQLAWPVLAGLALGALALTRPLDAVIVGLTATIWLMTGMAGRERVAGYRVRVATRGLPILALLGLAAAAVASLLFLYNRALTGDPFYTPQMMWTDRAWGVGSDRYGFGADIGIRAWPGIDPLPGHGAADVALNLNKNLFAAGADLFGWAGGSLVLVLLALVLRGGPRQCRLEVTLLIATVAGYSGYWFAGGPDLGPRYWYIALPALVTLAVVGARKLADRPGEKGRVAAALALATLAAALTFVPWRAATKYYRYRDIGAEIRELARQNDWDNALVFVRGGDREAYQAAFNFIDPALRPGSTVFARDTDAAGREAVLRYFPERPVWIVGPNSGPDRRLRVLAGPGPPGSMPR